MLNTILIFALIAMAILCWFLYGLWKHDRDYWKSEREKDHSYFDEDWQDNRFDISCLQLIAIMFIAIFFIAYQKIACLFTPKPKRFWNKDAREYDEYINQN